MYSSEETLRIEIPSNPNVTGQTDQQFSVFETSDLSHIKYLLIHQDGYHCEAIPSPFLSQVIIPDSINKFVAAETIKINAFITELPVTLSELTR